MQDDTHQAAVTRAREHIQRVVTRHPAAGSFDADQWTAVVLAHLEPLPANRAWRVHSARRRGPSTVGHLAPAVARRLTPPAGTRPQPKCPTHCFITHAYDTEVA